MTFWQYSTTGQVNGIQGNVDLNEYYGTDEQLQQLASGSPSGTMVGNISDAVEPIRDAAGNEAEIINGIEHATGVDIPLTTDFLMLVLGVAGGRLEPQVLIDQGLAQLQSGNVTGSVEAAQGDNALPAILAIANALKEVNASGKQVPVEALTGLASGNGDINATQLLGILQAFGGTQDWSAKLNNGEVPADPTALQQLSDAANGVNPAPAGTPLPPEAVNAALATLNQ